MPLKSRDREIWLATLLGVIIADQFRFRLDIGHQLGAWSYFLVVPVVVFVVYLLSLIVEFFKHRRAGL